MEEPLERVPKKRIGISKQEANGHKLAHRDLPRVRPAKWTTRFCVMNPAWAAMLKRVDEEQAAVYSPKRGMKDPRACEVATGAYGGFWAPFA